MEVDDGKGGELMPSPNDPNLTIEEVRYWAVANLLIQEQLEAQMPTLPSPNPDEWARVWEPWIAEACAALYGECPHTWIHHEPLR